MDEKTLRKKIERIVKEILEDTYCYYCKDGVVYDEPGAVETILRFVLELTKE